MNQLSISLIIPVFNESQTLESLIDTIIQQSLQPEEIILVDGGSTDSTVALAKSLIKDNKSFQIIEAGRAMPGKGRNIGAKKATCEWIAFTDAGIKLDRLWLEKLSEKALTDSLVDIIYGNYTPQINSLFDKCATIAYVPPLYPEKIRDKFIASSLMKKKVWEAVGGFPDWRATEDLVFIEKAERAGFHSAFAPEANVFWQLRNGFISTFKRFDLYSAYNVWAGRQAHWHYGIAKQYLIVFIFILLAIFQSKFWLLFLPLWIIARIEKRIWSHRYEFGTKLLFNPAIFFTVMSITLLIDVATFSGWIKALINKDKSRSFSIAK
jgi:glycosyltransferase involved in cell wall biosynthesis